MPSEISLVAVRRVTNDANHNAFTDLVRFNGRIYLTFRSCPEGHDISGKAAIRILRSDDGAEWREVNRFAVADRDTRDPHFLVFQDRLNVYTGTWDATGEGVERRELNDHLGYTVSTDDGESWSEPIPIESTRGHYVWRAASHDGHAFLCGRRKNGFASLPSEKSEWAIQQSIMLRSSDGLDFKQFAIFQPSYGDETAFVIDDNGSITALVRCRNWDQPAFICRSEPPYKDWERVQIDRNVGGPMLARWGNFLIAGGRRTIELDDPKTVLYWLEEGKLIESLELPGGGDCSYPGFLEIDPGHALVSYYSSHEGEGDPLYPASIYIAQIAVT